MNTKNNILFSLKKEQIGVDISDSSIKIVVLNIEHQLKSYGQAKLSRGIIKNGIVLKKEKFRKKLTEALERSQVDLSRLDAEIAVSIPDSQTFIHFFPLPKDFSDDDIENNIITEAERIIPFNIDEMYYDYFLSENKNNLSIVFVSARKDVVDTYQNILQELGVSTAVFENESFARWRALKAYHTEQKSVMVMDIGSDITSIDIFDDTNVLRFSITVPFGGSNITEAILATNNVLRKEAEVMKKEIGFDENKDISSVVRILKSESKVILDEAKDLLEQYKKRFNLNVEEIIIVGGSSHLHLIDVYFSKKLNCKIVIGDPNMTISYSTTLKEKELSTLFTTAIGLGLRHLGNSGFCVDFSPQRHKGVNRVKNDRRFRLHSIASHMSQVTQRLGNKSRLIFVGLFVALTFLFLGIVLYRSFTDVATKEILTQEMTDEFVFLETIFIEGVSDRLNVRDGPGATYLVVSSVIEGEMYQLLEESDGWYMIKVNNSLVGWIDATYARKKDP